MNEKVGAVRARVGAQVVVKSLTGLPSASLRFSCTRAASASAFFFAAV